MGTLVGRPRRNLQEGPHHLGQAGKIDLLAVPRLAVAEQQVVDRLHRRRIGEARRQLRGRLGRAQVLGQVRHRHHVDHRLVQEAYRTRTRQRRRSDHLATHFKIRSLIG